MRVDVILDKQTFRRFTVFNILKRLKLYKAPMIFSSILCISAIISLAMYNIDGAMLLAIVLLIVGLGTPVVYFTTFFRSLKKQIAVQNLLTPRYVYTVTLLDEDLGILVKNEKEEASFNWSKAFFAYLDKNCIYLFITKDRAFLIPLALIKEDKDDYWALILKRLGEKKCAVL